MNKLSKLNKKIHSCFYSEQDGARRRLLKLRDKRKLKNRRSAYKEIYEEQLRLQYEGKGFDEETIDANIEKIVRKRMNQKDIQKVKGETATEALDRIDFEEETEDLKDQ